MKLRRVLVVHSNDDPGTFMRIDQIDSNPAFKGTDFSHLIMLREDSAGYPALENAYAEGGTTQFNEALSDFIRHETTPLLMAKISAVEPELLLIHGGSIFRTIPEAILQMLLEVRSQYPGMPFALQARETLVEQFTDRRHRLFNGTTAAENLRHIEKLFADDEAIRDLIDKAF